MKYLLQVICCLLITFSTKGQNDYVQSTVARNNAFALGFYNTFNTSDVNIVLSPFGVSTCMAMAYIGSEGETQGQIAKEMNFITPYGVLVSFKQLIKRYQIYKSNDINLLVGNSLWSNSSNKLQKKYKNLLKVNFAAHVQELSFKSNDERSTKVINRWVKKNSNYNIRNIINVHNISEFDNLVYANYLYLNGNWENPFNELFTSKSDFVMADSTKTKVDFMNQTSYLRYNENDIFQILELPYAGRNISMIVILPKKTVAIDTIEQVLTPVNFDFWNDELYTKLVSVSLPKFRIEFTQDVVPYLRKNGLDEIFDEGANYERVAKNKAFVSQVIQKTIIEVGENKNNNFTELIVTPEEIKSGTDRSFIRFNANRPFIFIVKDNVNNSILLVGKVASPNFSNLSAEFYD